MYYKAMGLGSSRIIVRFLFTVQTPGAGSKCALGAKSNQTFYDPERIWYKGLFWSTIILRVISQCYKPNIPLWYITVNLCLSVHLKFLNIWIQLALVETACSEKLELKLALALYPVIPSVVGVYQPALHGSTENLQLCHLLVWLEMGWEES